MTAVRRVVFAGGRGLRPAQHVVLCDNVGVTCSFAQGRCRNPTVNGLISRYAGYLLSTGHTCDLVWCPTRFQPADVPTRVWQGAAKGLKG